MGPAATSSQSLCPNCGAKILRPELSLCAYCGSPLGIGKAPEAARSATAERLTKMRAHPDFGRAVQWMPEDPRETRAKAARVRAFAAGAAGGTLLAWGLAPWLLESEGGGARAILPLQTLAGAALVWLFALALRSALRLYAVLPKGALLSRPALVTERRSETRDHGAAFTTDYFFTLEFEDGSVGEFLFPGRGSTHDLLVPGNTGLAFTRAAVLLDFVKVRV